MGQFEVWKRVFAGKIKLIDCTGSDKLAKTEKQNNTFTRKSKTFVTAKTNIKLQI